MTTTHPAPTDTTSNDTTPVTKNDTSPFSLRVSPLATVMGKHPEWAYLLDYTQPTRPATEAETADYAKRADDPKWADIYAPAPVDYDRIGATA